MRQELHNITLAALALLLAACGVTMPEPTTLTASCRSTPPPAAAAETLHFASNRAPQCYRDGRYGFSGFRSHETVYGTSVLPVGDNGWRDHFSQRDQKPAWLDRLARASTGRPLLVYIHGYSNGFENALQRGQVLSRLAQPGTEVVVASWPSRNKFESYTYDEATIEWTTDEFETLLRDLVEVSGDITVVAHSMGNRAAIAAVVNLERERHAKAAHIRRMVLASPDVDRDHALRRGGQLDRLLANGQRELLVYTSSADLANRASHRVHGLSRLGSTDCRFDIDYLRQQSGLNDCHLRVKTDRLAIVDTGEVRSGGSRHADFVGSCAVREDLKVFLHGGTTFPIRARMGDDLRGGWKISRARAEAEGVLDCPRPVKSARRSGEGMLAQRRSPP